MPPQTTTKAQRKQAQAAEDSFHRTYSQQYGEERWDQRLLPALKRPTRYAVLVNRFAAAAAGVGPSASASESAGGDSVTTDPPPAWLAGGGALSRVELAPLGAASAGGGRLMAYQRFREEGGIAAAGRAAERRNALGSSSASGGDKEGGIEATSDEVQTAAAATSEGGDKVEGTKKGEGEQEEKHDREGEAEAEEPPFPPPQPDTSNTIPSTSGGGTATGLMTHWNLDAASLLAAAALDPQPGDKVLDLCAAPGGKSVAIAQMLFPPLYHRSLSSSSSSSGITTTETTHNQQQQQQQKQSPPSRGCLHSNEMHPARHKRLAANLAAYLPGELFEDGTVRVLGLDGTAADNAMSSYSASTSSAGGGSKRGGTSSRSSSSYTTPLPPGSYDRVLVDAPCSSERHLLHDSGGGLGGWRSAGSRNAAKTQTGLLMTALRYARAGGGRVVYATCSLSREENDGVVEKVVGELVGKERKRMEKLGSSKTTMMWGVKVRSGEVGVAERAKEREKRERRAARRREKDMKKKEEGETRADEGVKVEEQAGGREINVMGVEDREDEEWKRSEAWMEENWAERTKYGWIVLPDHKAGGRWGPLYFAVLEKIAG